MSLFVPRSLKGAALAPALLVLAACGGVANPAAQSLPAPGRASVPQALTGTWLLESLTSAGQGPVAPTEPERFTATFASDGRVSLRADCNRCGSTFAAGASSLEIGAMACTRAYCPSAPLDTDFARLVAGATTWTVAGGKLTLESTEGSVRLRP